MARATAPTSYYFNDGFDVVERVSRAGCYGHLRRRRASRPSDIDAAFFGLPGYGEASGDIEQLDAVPRGVLGHDRYSCDNDMVCGWAGSLGRRGRHQRHQRHRVDDLRRAAGRRPPGRRLG